MADSSQNGQLREALREMFNGDLSGSIARLDEYVAQTPADPLGHALSVVVPFYHFVGKRLKPHGGGSLHDMILGKPIAVPENLPQMKASLQRARKYSDTALHANPRDENALLALCIVEGVEREAQVLFYKRWMDSLKHAQAAASYARRLLDANPHASDAYYVIGLSEYVMTQIPALIRPFAKIPGVVGQKSRAIQFLEAAGRDGHYLQDFARQMLVTIYTEERRPRDAVRVLEGLSHDFPANTTYQTELEKLKSGERANLE
jgi:hypothetical protein